MTIETPTHALAASIEGRLRVTAQTARMWADDLIDDGARLDEAHAAVRDLARSHPAGRPCTYADLLETWRASRRGREAIDRTDRMLAERTGDSRLQPEARAQIARVAAAVALSGAAAGRTEAEVRDAMRALWTQPEEVERLTAEVSGHTKAGRRALAARAAAEPIRTEGWEGREAEIQRGWAMVEGRWVRR